VKLAEKKKRKAQEDEPGSENLDDDADLMNLD
jgi:hypothetical protein